MDTEFLDTESFWSRVGEYHLSWGVIAVAAIVLLVAAYMYVVHRDLTLGQAATGVASFVQERGTNVAWFTALAAVIVLLAVSAGRFAWSNLIDTERFSSIAPFVIGGAAEPDPQRGLALALALESKTREINRQFGTFNKYFSLLSDGDTDSSDTLNLPRQTNQPSTSIFLPPEPESNIGQGPLVLQPVNLEAKIGGVDIGGILSWVVGSVSNRGALRITVTETAGGDAIVSGTLTRDGTRQLYTTLKAENGKIENAMVVDAVAYSILSVGLAGQSEVAGLAWQDLQQLFESALTLDRIESNSGAISDDLVTAEYQKRLPIIKAIVARNPDSRRLISIAAKVAMNARQPDLALLYADKAIDLISDEIEEITAEIDSANESELDEGETAEAKQEEIDRLTDRRRDAFRDRAFAVNQRMAILSSNALQHVDKLNAGSSPVPVFAEALAAHKALVKATSLGAKQTPVAIVAGIPRRPTVGYPFKLIEGPEVGSDPTRNDASRDNLADTLGLIVHTIAPEAEIHFVRATGSSVLRAVTPDDVRKAHKSGAKVILVPYMPFGRASIPVLQAIEEVAEEGALVVALSISDGNRTRFLKDVVYPSQCAAFVTQTDIEGSRRRIVTVQPTGPVTYRDGLFAPGLRVPRVGTEGKWTAGQNTAFAAAIVAGVAANLIGAGAPADPTTLVSVLKQTSRVVDVREPDVRVINQEAAFNALTKNPPPAAPAPVPQGTCGHPIGASTPDETTAPQKEAADKL